MVFLYTAYLTKKEVDKIKTSVLKEDKDLDLFIFYSWYQFDKMRK